VRYRNNREELCGGYGYYLGAFSSNNEVEGGSHSGNYKSGGRDDGNHNTIRGGKYDANNLQLNGGFAGLELNGTDFIVEGVSCKDGGADVFPLVSSMGARTAGNQHGFVIGAAATGRISSSCRFLRNTATPSNYWDGVDASNRIGGGYVTLGGPSNLTDSIASLQNADNFANTCPSKQPGLELTELSLNKRVHPGAGGQLAHWYDAAGNIVCHVGHVLGTAQGYAWHLSAVGAGVYYCTTTGGAPLNALGATNVYSATNIGAGDLVLTSVAGPPGGLVANQWCMGNSDGLSNNTLYVRLNDSGVPASDAAHQVRWQ
jgi:hypothetical protein